MGEGVDHLTFEVGGGGGEVEELVCAKMFFSHWPLTHPSSVDWYCSVSLVVLFG